MASTPEDRSRKAPYDAEDQAIANEESPEYRAYVEELWNRMPAHARRAATIPPNEPGSVEWLARVGKFWWEAREQTRLSRYQLAVRAGIKVNQVRFLEFGLAKPEELRDELLRDYAGALGKTDLYNDYQSRFAIPPELKSSSVPSKKLF